MAYTHAPRGTDTATSDTSDTTARGTRWLSRLAGGLLALLLPVAALAQTQTITTVAGGGVGDGGPATNANISNPAGVALDAAGNLYIADFSGDRIRKVTPGGTISTYAGTGRRGGAGDGGPATSATLNAPMGVAVDAAGNLYIADFGNHRIRKVTPGGTISTVAGTGAQGFGGDGGPATAASLSGPADVSLDAAGNLYIADAYNHRIRRVSTTGDISTVAGNGTAGFLGDGGAAAAARLTNPIGVSVDASGNLYIADFGNHRVRKVAGGIITTLAGNGVAGFGGDGGAATAAALNSPAKVVVNASGQLFIADELNHRIRAVSSAGVITTVVGSQGTGAFGGDGGAATAAKLDEPVAITLDASGNLVVADFGNRRVRRIAGGVINTVAGNGTSTYGGDGGLAVNAAIFVPSATVMDAAGNLYIADKSNHRIRKVSAGGTITLVAGNGEGGFSGDGGAAVSARLFYPSGVALDGAGNLYIADQFNNRVRRVTPGGIISTVAGTGTQGFGGDGGPATAAALQRPYGISVDAAGNLYIADTYNQRIRKVTPGGIISTLAGNGAPGFSGDGGAATSASLGYPIGVTADSSGNVFIADYDNHRIRKVDAGGVISTVAGNGNLAYSGDGAVATNTSLYYPTAVAADANGSLYIADYGNNRVRRVSPAGFISTLAGNGTAAFSGDGDMAMNASLQRPVHVSLDAAGNAYITDQDNHRIRKVANAVTSGFNLTGVASRKSHGAAGTFDLPLNFSVPLSGAISVESRAIGTAGHRIVFQFDNVVTSVGAVTVQDASAAPVGTFTVSTAVNEVTVTLSGVPDNKRLTVAVDAVNGTESVSSSMGFLVGDSNHSASVNILDISPIRARSGQATNAGTFRYDLNADGNINVLDISAVRARAGRVIP